MANLMTIGRVMDWVEARQETIRLEEEDGDVNDDSGGEGALAGSSTVHGTGRTTAKAAAADGGAVSGADGRMNARATSHPLPTSAAGQPSSFASSSRQTSTGPPPPSPPPAVPPPTAFANAAAGSSSSSSMTVHAPRPAYPVCRPHSSTALDRPRRLASSPITPSSSPVQHAPSTSSTSFPPVSPLVTRRKPPSQPLPSSLSHSLDVNGPSSSSSSSTSMSTSDPTTSSSSFTHVPQSNFSFSLPPSTTTTQSAFGGHPSTALLPRPPPPPPSTATADKDSSVVLPSKRRFAALLPPQPSTTSSGSNDETMDDAASSGGATSTSSSAGGGGGGQNDRQSRRKGRRGATRVSEGRQGGLADVIEHVGQEGDEREKKRVTRR